MKFIKLFFMIFFITAYVQCKIKVLHLTFHPGCLTAFEYVAQELNLDLTSIMPQGKALWFDGKTLGNDLYNVSHQMAHDAWEKNKDFFKSFDVIITSDTAPLSRVFLQNGWPKPLIIWVCNRFDYFNSPSKNFPDAEFYDLFRDATQRPNVKIISYTPFEHHYALSKNINWDHCTITPCMNESFISVNSSIPRHINKAETFFIPPYSNDTSFNLEKRCKKLGISCYQGRYNGAADLKDFKGIIHIPYSWSNLALFENLSNGMIYFIPSVKFLLKLKNNPKFFFPNNPNETTILLSEWYQPEHAHLFVFFDSWRDLEKKIKTLNYEEKRTIIKQWAYQHRLNTLQKWQSVFENLLKNK